MLADGDRTTWLRAQIDEDERVVRAAANGYLYPDGHDDSVVAFLNHFGHERALAEVSANRRMVARIEALMIYARAQGLDKVWDWAAESLKVEALPYADRPGFPEDWKT